MATLSKSKQAALESWIRKVMRVSHHGQEDTTASRFIFNGIYDDYRLLELIEIIQGKQVIRQKHAFRFRNSDSGGRHETRKET